MSSCPVPNPPHILRPLIMAHTNINSITTPGRLDELEMFVSTHDIDIICITETKLDTTVNKSLYHMDNFNQPLVRHRNRHGGGVAIYHRNSIAITRLPELELDAIEWIWAKVKVSGSMFIICCVYLPPNLVAADYQDFLDKFTDSIAQAQTHNPSSIIILGDFNVGNIFLNGKYTQRHSGLTPFDLLFKETLTGLGLVQLIDHPTRMTETTANLRDLVITSNTEMVVDSGLLSSFSHIDHVPIYVTVKCERPDRKTLTSSVWDYKRMNIELFVDRLIRTDWDDLLNRNVSEATEMFTHAILEAAYETIPRRTIKLHSLDKPWVTQELKAEIARRNRLFKRAKRTETQRSWLLWKIQRNKVTALNKNLKAAHVRNQVQKLTENKHDPRRYHQLLKNILSRKINADIPPLEDINGQLATDDVSKANVLNDYFAQQSRNDCPDKPAPNIVQNREVPTLNKISITEHEVLTVLNKLNVNKSCGFDRIPNKMLKLAAIILKDPLAKLFNKSLTESVYPTSWKHAKITPIYKNKGAPSDPQNYRPISLLPSLSKVFEKLVFAKIYAHLDENGLITDKQSGYRPYHGTQNQLLFLINSLFKALDENKDFTTIYLDISRYFDRIWHEGLLAKCEYQCGITGNLLKWLKSYLRDRTHSVSVNDAYSRVQTIDAGCPQGSVLGPLLALIYLNDLDGVTENNLLFFADDTLLFKAHPHGSDDATKSLQADLNEIQTFGDKWSITFNSSKTIQQTFTNRPVKNHPKLRFGHAPLIPVENSHKHLGLTISSSLRFHDHVNDMIKKANSALGPLYPVAEFLPRKILNQIYCTYVRPIFDYSDIVYHGHLTVTDSMRLERTQHRAARLVTGALFRTPTDSLLQDLGWTKLRARRKINCLIHMYKLVHPAFQIPQYLTDILPDTRDAVTTYTLRGASNISLPMNRLSSYSNSFIPLTIRAWNKLPTTIRNKPTLQTFKRAVAHECGVPKPPLFFSYGPKKLNIFHTRLRLGVSTLNAHLFKLHSSKTDYPHCACGYSQETTSHFLLGCRLHNEYRQALETSLGNIIPNFSNLTRALLGLWISHRLLGGGAFERPPHDLGSWSP